MSIVQRKETFMIEIFSHDVSVRPDVDTEGVFIISGKDWENEHFDLYIREDEAASLLWQLNFYITQEASK